MSLFQFFWLQNEPQQIIARIWPFKELRFYNCVLIWKQGHGTEFLRILIVNEVTRVKTEYFSFFGQPGFISKIATRFIYSDSFDLETSTWTAYRERDYAKV
jgi:hypothetical protein